MEPPQAGRARTQQSGRAVERQETKPEPPLRQRPEQPPVQASTEQLAQKVLQPQEQPRPQSPAPPEPKPVQARPSRPLSIREAWDETLRRIEDLNHPLCFKLQEGEAIFEEDRIRIVFSGGHAFHAESVKESLPSIRKTLHEVSGRTVEISVETKDGKKSASKKDLKEKALQDPVIIEALELFEGRIVDVIPNKEGSGTTEE
ncbi:MAG: hypothetical protein HGA78_12655 [Nitrospirales bacterium]|nr:hypothetical protein [Nitrospirales bacterium]